MRRGAAFWLAVFTELQNRGLKDIFIACMDGLTGLPETVGRVSPHTLRVQLCMVHMVHRRSNKFSLQTSPKGGSRREAGLRRGD